MVKGTEYYEVTNKEVYSWEHTDDLEAVLAAEVEKQMGLKYFPTDYATNKSLYLNNPTLNISFTGIALTLSAKIETAKELNMADDFIGFFPDVEMGKYGCYTFIGEIETVQEQKIFEKGIIDGYIIHVKLVNSDTIKNSFTIPLFANKENTDIDKLEKGLRVSGLFQLLGEIA